MQTQTNKRLYIPAIVLMAVLVFALSPIAPAFAQDSADVDSSDPAQDEKSYEGKDGKSCGDKHRDKTKNTVTSGNQA